MRIKRFVILIMILIFISLTIYMYRPIHFHKDTFNSNSITITYLIDNTIKNGTVVPDMQSITWNNHSTNFHKFEQLIEKYTYHKCIHTLIGKATCENTSRYFSLFSKNKIIYISDTPHIIIDDKVYRIGYWGDAKINNLIGDIKKLLKN